MILRIIELLYIVWEAEVLFAKLPEKKYNESSFLPILVTIVFGITWYVAKLLFAITTQDLRIKSIFMTTTIS